MSRELRPDDQQAREDEHAGEEREHYRPLVLAPGVSGSAIEEMIDAVQTQITDALATLTDEYDDAIEEIVADI